VASYPTDRHAQGLKARERCAGEGARNSIASNNHDVRIRRLRIGEHSVERIDVALNVIQRKDAHH